MSLNNKPSGSSLVDDGYLFEFKPPPTSKI